MAFITKTVECWQINDPEMPAEVKSKVLEKHYDINVDHEWWEPSSIYFPSWANGEIQGFDLDRRNSVEFTLDIDYRKLKATLAREKVTTSIQAGYQSKKHNNHPYFFRVTGFDFDHFDFKIKADKDKIILVFPDLPGYDNTLTEPSRSEIKSFITENLGNVELTLSKHDLEILSETIFKVVNYVESQIDPLKCLREDYEYKISYNQIIETLEANEYHFDREGQIV